MQTSRPLRLRVSRQPTSGRLAGRARTSATPTPTARDSMGAAAGSSTNLQALLVRVGLDGLSWKTSWGSSAPNKGPRLKQLSTSLKKLGIWAGGFACNTLDFGIPHHRERVFVVASYRSDAAIRILADCCERNGDPAAGTSGKAQARSSLRKVPKGNNPLLVQRRGGFGYTKAKSICPTIRAQTGGHQGGHSDRPIVCSQKLNLGRMREANGVSGRLDGRRGRLIGNAVAPPIAEWIGRQIITIEAEHRAEEAS